MTKATFGGFLRQNWFLIVLALAALAAMGWFGTQFILDFLYFNDPRNVDVDLKGWMTPRFIVLTYDLPRPFVFDLLELSSEEPRGQRLRFIAENLGLTMEELTEKVRAAAQQFRAENP